MDTSTIDDAQQASLDTHLERLGLERSTPPGQEQWSALLDVLEKVYPASTVDDVETVESMLQRQVTKRRSNQTNLFERSPIAILQLNLSSVESEGEEPTDSARDLGRLMKDIQITAANPAATSLLGIPALAVREPVDTPLAGISAVAWTKLIDMVLDGETTSEIEFVGSRSDGSAFEALLLAAVPEPFGIPDYSRVVVSMTDITAHKAEERRMHELVTSTNRLVATVTNELGSPLAEVIDFAGLLKEPVQDVQRRRDLAMAIAGGATRVASIVEDLLIISRSELGDLVLAEVPVNLSAQVAQVLEVGGASLSGVTTPGRNVEPRICIGDPARVRQIIRNLLTDAVDDNEDSATSVTVHRRASTMYLTVTSGGPPLGDSLVERVFGPPRELLQAPVDPDTRFMRLAVSRQLAIAMGGEITYRHEDGLDVFEVTLRSAPTD